MAHPFAAPIQDETTRRFNENMARIEEERRQRGDMPTTTVDYTRGGASPGKDMAGRPLVAPKPAKPEQGSDAGKTGAIGSFKQRQQAQARAGIAKGYTDGAAAARQQSAAAFAEQEQSRAALRDQHNKLAFNLYDALSKADPNDKASKAYVESAVNEFGRQWASQLEAKGARLLRPTYATRTGPDGQKQLVAQFTVVKADGTQKVVNYGAEELMAGLKKHGVPEEAFAKPADGGAMPGKGKKAGGGDFSMGDIGKLSGFPPGVQKAMLAQMGFDIPDEAWGSSGPQQGGAAPSPAFNKDIYNSMTADGKRKYLAGLGQNFDASDFLPDAQPASGSSGSMDGGASGPTATQGAAAVLEGGGEGGSAGAGAPAPQPNAGDQSSYTQGRLAQVTDTGEDGRASESTGLVGRDEGGIRKVYNQRMLKNMWDAGSNLDVNGKDSDENMGIRLVLSTDKHGNARQEYRIDLDNPTWFGNDFTGSGKGVHGKTGAKEHGMRQMLEAAGAVIQKDGSYTISKEDFDKAREHINAGYAFREDFDKASEKKAANDARKAKAEEARAKEAEARKAAEAKAADDAKKADADAKAAAEKKAADEAEAERHERAMVRPVEGEIRASGNFSVQGREGSNISTIKDKRDGKVYRIVKGEDGEWGVREQDDKDGKTFRKWADFQEKSSKDIAAGPARGTKEEQDAALDSEGGMDIVLGVNNDGSPRKANVKRGKDGRIVVRRWPGGEGVSMSEEDFRAALHEDVERRSRSRS